MSAESGELLGTAQFVGDASPNTRGRLQWKVKLSNTSFDPGVLVYSGQLRLEFDNGDVLHGFARHTTGGGTSAELIVTGDS